MRPTEILSNEHRVIEIVLDCLEKLASQSRASGTVDQQSAEQIIDFIKTFADGCHHSKEETHLFVALEKKGASREHGPVGVMLQEHEMGRSFVRQMKANIAKAASGDAGAVKAFCQSANEFVQLLRAHIMKEDQILYPIADQTLSEDEHATLLADFQHTESHHMGEGTHERYLELARSLAKHFGVEASILQAHEGHSSCGCSHAKSEGTAA